MIDDIHKWATRNGVSADAISELYTIFGMFPESDSNAIGDESLVQVEVRLEASRNGVRLFRNNVGALIDSRGVPVRYGLANDSKKVNSVIKSADLIGWRTVTITPEHVGQQIAQFVSRECKRRGWKYTGGAHEVAQLAWLKLVVAGGGDAKFTTGEGTL